MYYIRLDDACEKHNMIQWERMEELLDRYSIKPLVGVIPHCEDEKMQQYPTDVNFWSKVANWRKKGWTIAMHGYNHVYSTCSGGINPVNRKSEFAGEPLEVQRIKIQKGVEIFRKHNIEPKVFFAPSHTFDENTLSALEQCSSIRTISDTIARDIYNYRGFSFVPQQSGRVRKIMLKTVTFCYHPNVMSDETFAELEQFLRSNHKRFASFPDVVCTTRKRDMFDKLLQRVYFLRRW